MMKPDFFTVAGIVVGTILIICSVIMTSNLLEIRTLKSELKFQKEQAQVYKKEFDDCKLQLGVFYEDIGTEDGKKTGSK